MTKGYSSSYFVLDTDFSSTKTINVVFATSIFHAIKLPNFVCDRSSKIKRHFWPLQHEFDIGIVFVAERVRENFVSKMKIDYCRWQLIIDVDNADPGPTPRPSQVFHPSCPYQEGDSFTIPTFCQNFPKFPCGTSNEQMLWIAREERDEILANIKQLEILTEQKLSTDLLASQVVAW